MAQQEGCSSPPRSLSRFSSLPTPFLHTHISRRARCTLAQLDNILSPCPLSALAVRQIPLSPPNRVAFEPAALLFVYHLFFIGRLQHHQTIAQNNSATHNFQKFSLSLLTNRPGCCKLKLGFLAAKIGGVTF